MKVGGTGGDSGRRIDPAECGRGPAVRGYDVTCGGGVEAEKHSPMPPAVTCGKCRVLMCTGVTVVT